jgi:hypothetical protein
VHIWHKWRVPGSWNRGRASLFAACEQDRYHRAQITR